MSWIEKIYISRFELKLWIEVISHELKLYLINWIENIPWIVNILRIGLKITHLIKNGTKWEEIIYSISFIIIIDLSIWHVQN